MKKLATILGLTAVLAMAATSAFAANQVRISQAWGGGGSATATATYNVDYVELFNSGNTPVNIGGWTIEYGSATGSWGSTASNIFTFPVGATIQPCKYVLVQLGTPSAGGAALPVTADYSGTLNMGGTNGKVALFNAVNTNLACGSEIAGTLVDKVSWGTANCSETAATPAMSINLGAGRNGDGMTDTDNNSADFTMGVLIPRNSASPANTACLATPTVNKTWGSLKSIYR